MNQKIQSLIEQLRLQPHPEGGYYRETYRAPLEVVTPAHRETRSAYTSIHFLLEGQQYSAWHRVASCESWFCRLGCDLQVFSLMPATQEPGKVVQVQTIGLSCGNFELTVPAGRWFAAKPVNEQAFSLVSCVVGPGFVFDDFEMASRQALVADGYHSSEDWPLIESLIIKNKGDQDD